jgi:monofunctional biosynthetic peptidoglycan transglycosylase
LNDIITSKKLELEEIFERLYHSFESKPRIKSTLFFSFVVFYLAIPGFHIPSLEFFSTRISGVMEQRAFQNYLVYFPSQDWVDYDAIPIYAKQGSIAMEDGLFMQHRGVDWVNLNASIRANKRRGKIVRGGSTITMQLAKNIYFTTSRNYFRKAKEIIVAIRMEKEISKRDILEQYLNVIELGRGIFGIGEAANFYFDRDVVQLTRDQCARLIAIIPSPIKNKPTDNRSLVLSRKGRVLARMSSTEVPE